MIEPTVGRVVLYTPDTEDDQIHVNYGVQPMAATVAYVWNERMVNLSVVDHNGKQFSLTSVPLAQDDDAVSPGMCEWMEYQKGQAAKTEEALSANKPCGGEGQPGVGVGAVKETVGAVFEYCDKAEDTYKAPEGGA